MSLGVRKESGGYAVFDGREALVRGLRERTDAFKIRYDLLRKGWFRGAVVFARNGKKLEITVPADHGSDAPTYDAYGRPPEERTRDGLGRFIPQQDDEESVDDL